MSCRLLSTSREGAQSYTSTATCGQANYRQDRLDSSRYGDALQWTQESNGRTRLTRGKRKRGRPVIKPLPPRIDAPPEAIAGALLTLPANHEWEFLKKEQEAKARRKAAV